MPKSKYSASESENSAARHIGLRHEHFTPIVHIQLPNGRTFPLGKATQSQVDEIVDMVNFYSEIESKGALVPVLREEASNWVSKGLDYVVMDGNKIISHTAVDCWPKDAKTPLACEIRSVVVDAAYRNNHIYSWESLVVIDDVFKRYPNAIIVEEKESKAGGYRLLEKLGFVQYDFAAAQRLCLDTRGLEEGEWIVYGITKRDYESHVSEVRSSLECLLRNASD